MSQVVTTPSSDEQSAVLSDEDQKKSGSDGKEANSDEQKSSSEAEPVGHDEDESLHASCKIMFQKISDYLQSELAVSLEDYELLEQLNELTKQKYSDMDNITNSLIGRMEAINEKYKKLQPYLEMIEKVDTSVTNLEQAAYKLDAYSKELEARFKKLEKTAS